MEFLVLLLIIMWQIIGILKERERRATEEAQKAAELSEKKKREERLFKKLTQYAEYTGRDKRIKMLSDNELKTQEALVDLPDLMSPIYAGYQQKKSDGNWAIIGGITSGIAGPAAGLAAAADAQARTARENAQIRAQNEANRKAIDSMQQRLFDSGTKKANAIRSALSRAKEAIVTDDSTEQCYERLGIQHHTTVSPTGTCIVKTYLYLKSGFQISDGKRGTVDGTILASIYNGDTLVGTATMVLPIFGIHEAPASGYWDGIIVSGMLLDKCKQGEDYSVKFSPVHLWAMELDYEDIAAERLL